VSQVEHYLSIGIDNSSKSFDEKCHFADRGTNLWNFDPFQGQQFVVDVDVIKDIPLV